MSGQVCAAGWTLIEFLIAMALGLVVALMASGLLLSAASSYRSHNEHSALNYASHDALAIMAQAIRQAAYINWDRKGVPPELDSDASAAIAGLDAHSISHSSAGLGTPLPAVAHGSDVLALRFSGSGEGTSGDGSSLNCAGFGVPAAANSGARGWNIFYVAADADGDAELRCKYRGASGWGADAIVQGVDSFQVLYGLDTDSPADGTPNTYVNASAIDGLDAALVLSGTTPDERLRDLQRRTHWKRVCSIQLALLLHGAARTRADTATQHYDLFGPAYADAHADDLGVRIDEATLPPAQRARARKLVALTVALRNPSG